MSGKHVIIMTATCVLSLWGCGDPEPSTDCGEQGSRCAPAADMGGQTSPQDMASAVDMPVEAMATGPLGQGGTLETVAVGEAVFLATSEQQVLVARPTQTGQELETDAWLVSVEEARTFLGATALSQNQWLVVSEERGLELLDAGGLSASPLESLIEMNRIDQVHFYQDASAASLWLGGTNIYLWSDDALMRVDASALQGGARLFLPPAKVDDGADVWAYNERGVHALRRDLTDQSVTVTVMREGAVRSAASNHGAAWIATTSGEVFRHAGEGAWQKLKLEVPIASIHAHPRAPDVWFVAEDGALWHLWGEVLRETPHTVTDGAVLEVDGAGRLLEVRDGGLSRHDRRLRMELEGLTDGELIVEPREITLQVTFAADLEGITATSGNIEYPAEVSDGVARFMLDPAALGPGNHTLTVKGKWRGVSEDAVPGVEVAFRVESGELSWQTNIRPIFEASCEDCHSVQANKPFHTQALWVQEYENILVWVEPGNMPPGSLPKLTPAQINLIKDWAAQGYPE